METVCIRCGNSFDSDSLDMDLCPNCDLELNELDEMEERNSGFDDDDDDDDNDWDS